MNLFRRTPPTGFQLLESAEDLERVLSASATTPVLIYKHSLSCGSSAYALERLRELAARRPDPIYMVKVQTARPVSDELARRLGVRHESPQILLVENGAVVWHASHFGVSSAAVGAALDRHLATRTDQVERH